MKWFFLRKWYAFLSRKNALDRIKRSVPIENKLLQISKGQRPLPTKEECWEGAKKLGGITLILISTGCSTCKAICYIPPKDAPRLSRTINWESVGHEYPRTRTPLLEKNSNRPVRNPARGKTGYIPTYSIGIPVSPP